MSEIIQFVHAKPYAGFLLKHKLEQLAKDSLELYRENRLPLLKFFEGYSDEVLIKKNATELSVFLADIIQNNAWPIAIKKLQKWKDNQLGDIDKDFLDSTDIIIINSVRKQVFLKTLPEYTSDPQLIVSIAQEFDIFYAELEKKALEIYNQLKQTEVQESKKQFQVLSESSFDAVFIHNDGKIILTNSAAEKKFGYTSEELLNLKIFDLVEDSGVLLSSLDSLQEERPLEVKGIRKDGIPFYAEALQSHVKYKDEDCGVLVLRDITHLKAAEETLQNHKEELEASNDQLTKQILEREELEDVLREREYAFRLLAENSSDIIARVAPDGTFLYVSPSCRDIIGYAADELIDTNIFAYIPSEDLNKVKLAFSRGVLSGDIQVVEHRFRDKYGSLVWLESTGHSIKGENEEVIEIQVAGRSIGDRKAVEQKLYKERQFLKGILDNLNESIIACNEEGQIMFFNKVARQLHGLEAGEEGFPRPEHWAEVYELFESDGETNLQPDEVPLTRAFRGEPFKNVEISTKSKAGELRFFLTSGQPIYNKQKEKLGALVVMHDVTSIKNAETELTKKNKALKEAYDNLKNAQLELQATNNLLEQKVNERTKELKETNKDLKKEIYERENVEKVLREKNTELVKINNDLDNFVYTASHDLKAPVSNIEGLISALASESSNCSDEGLQEIIGMINISIGKFKQTLDELAEISKIQRSIHEDVDEINVKKLTEEVLLSLEDLVIRSGAEISMNFSDEYLCFSQKDLRSVIYNLINNSLKYRTSKRPLKIDISGQNFKEYYLFTVKDNGLGIDPANQDKIFHMFKRLHDHVEGSGVGLYIVKRIVENNGGKIEVESKPDVGAVFKLYLKR